MSEIYLQRMLKSREVSPKPEDDQGSFSEDMIYENLQGKEELDQGGEITQTEGPGLKH